MQKNEIELRERLAREETERSSSEKIIRKDS